MTNKEQGKRAILRISLFISAVLLMVLTFHSCQKDDFFEQAEPVAIALKSATSATVVYPEVFAGPASFSPVKGKIIKQTITLENQNYDDYETVFALVVQNGDENGLNQVAGANIYVNGTQVFSMADFRKAPAVMYREINNLGATTTIDVEVKGKTTNVLTLWIEGTLGQIALPTFTDGRDGHEYKMVTLGTQTWMAENLAYKTETGSSALNNDESNDATYGRFYTWYAATNNACPTGWHLPYNAEWNTLVTYLTDNGYGYEGSGDDIAKALASTTGWGEYGSQGAVGNDPESNNSSGFNALPAGARSYMGDYQYFGYATFWWTADQHDPYSGVSRDMWYYDSRLNQQGLALNFGFSVRCIKDAE